MSNNRQHESYIYQSWNRMPCLGAACGGGAGTVVGDTDAHVRLCGNEKWLLHPFLACIRGSEHLSLHNFHVGTHDN